MKTIQVSQHGSADVLKLIETETPKPKPGQALVKIHYAGVNFIDVAMRRGWYPNPPIPISQVFAVEDAIVAHHLMEDRSNMGKILLKI